MKTILSPMRLWYHDLGSCLHSCMATILTYHQHDIQLTLGACWDFYHDPRQFKREEYYYPLRWSGLAESLMPYHPISSRWHSPVDAAAGWQEVKQAVLEGNPVIVAVDNFHLPFRPAYHDIHAGHLIVAYGIDEERDEVYVADGPPPGYQGPLSVQQFQAARGSENPPDERDFFFSSTPTAYRWIEVQLQDKFPPLTRGWIKEIVQSNIRRFHEPDDGEAYSGIAGLYRYFSRLSMQETEEECNTAFEELYVMGWGVQAGNALHADFLIKSGLLLNWPRLSEIGRQVDRLAHHWTDLRMQAAHARLHANNRSLVLQQLKQRSTQLLSEQTMTLEQLAWLIGA